MREKRQTVLHFIDTTGPGGAETVLMQTALGLSSRGWPARIGLIGQGWLYDAVRDLGLPVDLVPTRGRADLRYVRLLRSLVQREKIGLIHAHLFSPAVYASLVGRWSGVPVVATFHGASDVRAGHVSRRLRYKLIGAAGHVVCVSESLRREVLRSRLVDSQRVTVIHNGVDLARFSEPDGNAVRRAHGILPEMRLVGALGNMRPAKDYANFLRAASILSTDTSLQFAIAGECTDPYYSELCRERDRLGLTDRVHFWGFRDDVPNVLAAFDVLAISSGSEGFSIAAVQAMAVGTPVVATRSGGPEEIITHGHDGLLVPPRSPEALASAVRKVLDDGQLSDLFRNNARRTASERFSLNRMLENYEDLYVRLLSNAPVLSEGTSGLPSAAGGKVYQQLESGHASSAPDL